MDTPKRNGNTALFAKELAGERQDGIIAASSLKNSVLSEVLLWGSSWARDFANDFKESQHIADA